MKPSKGFVIRVFLYSGVLLYLAADLFVFQGPVANRIQESKPFNRSSYTQAQEMGVAAIVYGKPIYLEQVEQAARQRLCLEGRSLGDLPPQLRREQRLAALNDLIDHELLRTKVQANQREFPISDSESEQLMAPYIDRFSDMGSLKSALQVCGIDSEREFRLRLGAREQQLRYIESRISDSISTSDEEVKEWVEAQKKQVSADKLIYVYHIYLPNDYPNGEKILDEAKEKIEKTPSLFAALAASISQDEETKDRGGSLGWVSLKQLPPMLSDQLSSVPLQIPTIITSNHGRHLVKFVERLGVEELPSKRLFDEALNALTNAKREERTNALREAIQATETIGVHRFLNVITDE